MVKQVLWGWDNELRQAWIPSINSGTFPSTIVMTSCKKKEKEKLTHLPTSRCYVTPLLGAYIADSYWGRFKTICVAVVIALVGHVVLIISAVPGVIEQKGATGAFVIALIIMGFGMGIMIFPWFQFFFVDGRNFFFLKVPGCSRRIFRPWSLSSIGKQSCLLSWRRVVKRLSSILLWQFPESIWCVFFLSFPFQKDGYKLIHPIQFFFFFMNSTSTSSSISVHSLDKSQWLIPKR